MIKLVYTLCFILIYGIGQAQSDSITIPVSTVLNAANKIVELERRDSLKTIQIVNLQVQLTGLEHLNENNQSIIELKNKEIDIYRNALKNVIPTIDQPKVKWYQTPAMTFMAGVFTGGLLIYAGASIIY